MVLTGPLLRGSGGLWPGTGPMKDMFGYDVRLARVRSGVWNERVSYIDV